MGADLDLALGLWGDAEVTRLIGGPFSLEQVQQRLAQEIANQAAHAIQYWPIFLLTSDEHVGCCGLRSCPSEPRVYELGFHLRKMYWGQGLAVEAARAVIEYAFTTLDAAGLFAGHHPANEASRRVLIKLGFRYTHDELYPPTGLRHPSYRLTREEKRKLQEPTMRTSEAIDADLQRVIDANSRFGLRLLSWLVEHDAGKNVFISSFSVATALAMTYNGADGKTKAALAELLGLTDFNLQQVNEANASLISMQNGLDAKVQLAIANSIWIRTGMTPSADFMRRIKIYYAGQVASLDFSRPDAADVINDWVAEKTYEKIRELVTPPLISQAILILINAVYFKAMWATPFDTEKTAERVFHTFDGSDTLCPMMAQSGYYDYAETDEFQAVSLPYGDGRVSLYLFLPKPTHSIGDFQKSLNFKNWQKWMNYFDRTQGDIILPRFKIEYGQDLITGLQALGGDEIVGVDFMGMGAGPLRISNVIHKTFVEVNEEGTEAAAATAVIMKGRMPPKPFTLCVDRPFFAAIRDNSTGAVLFAGYVLDPTQD